eukprot:5967588-Lingulodinium_polyedra.AAC.1
MWVRFGSDLARACAAQVCLARFRGMVAQLRLPAGPPAASTPARPVAPSPREFAKDEAPESATTPPRRMRGTRHRK